MPWKDPIPALKRQLADEILAEVEGCSQDWAAAFMQITRARVSEMRRGKLENISLERMIQCLSRLRRVTTITTMREAPSRRGPARAVPAGKQLSRTG